MTKDKKVLYLTSLISLAVLLVALFTVKRNGRIVAACLMALVTPAVCLLVRKRSAHSIAKRDVLLMMLTLAVIVSALIEMTGLHFGYYKNPYYVNLNVFLTLIIPIATVIITTETVRSVLLAQKNGAVDAIAFIIGVTVETLAFSGIAGISTFNQFMDLVGMTLFPALSANFFYNFVSKRYGAMPNIAYRLITVLYVYFMPQTTAMNDALSACIKILTPILMYALISAMFRKTKKNAVEKGEKLSLVGTSLALAAIVLVAMLISCQFRFGALVIATESMTGEINKGDMIIYERYDDQKIKEGQVIVFLQNEAKIVHRVIKIDRIDGEVRYYTQGDANKDPDSGYRTDADIVGLTDVKIAYVGYPTLWLRDIISNQN